MTLVSKVVKLPTKTEQKAFVDLVGAMRKVSNTPAQKAKILHKLMVCATDHYVFLTVNKVPMEVDCGHEVVDAILEAVGEVARSNERIPDYCVLYWKFFKAPQRFKK